MNECTLYKKEGTYFDEKTKKDKSFTNFYLKIGNELIPIEVKYFPSEKFEGRDPGYSARRAVMSAFAQILPEKN